MPCGSEASSALAQLHFGGTKGGVMAMSEWAGDLMDVAETARVLNVPVSWVYGRTRRRGKERIPHIKLGKYLRFENTLVQEWVKGLRQA